MVTTPLSGRTILATCILACTLLLSPSCSEQDGPRDNTGRADGDTADSAPEMPRNIVSAGDTAGARQVEVRPETITMTYNVKPGDTFSYKVTQNNRRREGDVALEDNTIFYYTKRVTSVSPDSQITMTMRFDRIVMRNTMPITDSTGKVAARVITYNSADSADRANPAFARYSALIGNEAVLVVSPRGDIIDIRSVEPVADKIIKTMKRDSVSEAERNFLLSGIAMNAYGMVHTQEFQVYPKKTLDSTRSWTAVYPAPLAGIFPTENVVTYRIDNIVEIKGRRVAEISATLNSKVLKKQQSNEYGTIVLKNGGLTGGSEHLVDLEKGFTILKKSRLSEDITVNTTRKADNRSEQTQQQTISDIIVELL